MPTDPARVLRERLANQSLDPPRFDSAADVVRSLGAVQAQDFPGAAWAIGQRTRALAAMDVEAAFDRGEILRTHMMRPTWHFVSPADIRWMLALTSPRVQAGNGPYYRRFELDGSLLVRGTSVIERALAGKRYLTRNELAARLGRSRIHVAGHRLAYLVMFAELEGVICSGPKRGKQFTYALVEERARRTKPIEREEALVNLARRYFASHGPATVRDFCWWSGLRVKDAESALAAAGDALRCQSIAGLNYWRAGGTSKGSGRASRVHLLPNYDEYLIAHQDRQLFFAGRTYSARPTELRHHVVANGVLRGSWTSTVKPRGADLRLVPYGRLSDQEHRLLRAAVSRYQAFLGVPVHLAVT